MIVDLGFCVIRCFNIWDFGPVAYMDCDFTTGPIQAIMVIWSDGMNFFNQLIEQIHTTINTSGETHHIGRVDLPIELVVNQRDGPHG